MTTDETPFPSTDYSLIHFRFFSVSTLKDQKTRTQRADKTCVGLSDAALSPPKSKLLNFVTI